MQSRVKQINLTWNLSPKQAQLFNAQERFRVGMLGRRFGKNEVATAAVVDYATQPDKYEYGADEDAVIWWVGNSYNQTKKYGFQKVLEKLPEVLIDGTPKRSAPFEIPLINGCTIEFYSYDRPSSLQGAGVDFMAIDEAAYMDSEVWDNDLRPMLLDANGGAIFISKPLGENWFFELFNRSDTDPAYYSVHGTSYENPWIDNEEIDRVKRTTPEGVFRQQYLADPQAGGTLLTLDMLESSDWSVLDVDHQWRWHIAVDIGVTMDPQKARENDNDYWAAAIVAEHPRIAKAYVTQVMRKRGQTPAQAAEWIQTVCSQAGTQQVHYEAVQAQEWLSEDIRDVGLTPIPVDHDRPKKERLMFLSVPFSNGNVELIDWGSHPDHSFDWSAFRTEWASFPNGKHDDQLDAVEMALRQCNFVGSGLTMSADPYNENDGR